MRILHLGKFAPPAVGGMETFLAALMNRQALDGHHVHAVRLCAPGDSRVTERAAGGPKTLRERFFAPFPSLSPTTSGPFPDIFPRLLARLAPGERLRPQDPPPSCLDVPALWPAGPAPFAPGYRAAVRALAEMVRPDVVHAHLPNLSALWSLPQASIPLVVHWHADVPREALPRTARLAWPAYNLLLDRALARAARIVCTSREGRDASPPLRKHRDKCVVVPLGIEPRNAEATGREPCPAIEPDSAAKPWREPCPEVEQDAADPMERAHCPAEAESAHNATGHARRPVTVLGLGRFTPYKGFDVLTRAAALAPSDLRFILAGEGPLLGSVRALAASLGVRDRMAFAGRVDDARRDRLLAECDIFCLPAVNRAEAFGLVALEAMSFARPVVACSPKGSGVAEVVEHEVTGLVVPSLDPEALARALARLAARPDERARMGRAGRRRLVERFDLGRVALALEEVYRQAEQQTGR